MTKRSSSKVNVTATTTTTLTTTGPKHTCEAVAETFLGGVRYVNKTAQIEQAKQKQKKHLQLACKL